MTHLPPSPSRSRLAVLAAAFGLAVLAAPAAQAFTMDTQSNTNINGAARYTDPDEQFSGASSGQPTIKQGNATFQFGQPQSFDQRYSTDNLFNPNGRPGEGR
jgi:hypothetical protein